MKILYYFSVVASLLIFSCANDDESPSEPQIPENEKLVESINVGTSFYEFEYNSDKTVKTLNIADYYLFNFSYQNGRISSTMVLVGGQVFDYFFEYNDNGKLSAFSLDDEITLITYNAEQNYYLYQKENGDEFTLFLNENEDIYRIMTYEAEYDETENIVMLYENSAKGTLTNTNNISIPIALIMGEVEAGYFMFPISNKPIKTISGMAFGNLSFENRFDEQGFISESSYSIPGEGGPVTIKYNYTQL